MSSLCNNINCMAVHIDGTTMSTSLNDSHCFCWIVWLVICVRKRLNRCVATIFMNEKTGKVLFLWLIHIVQTESLTARLKQRISRKKNLVLLNVGIKVKTTGAPPHLFSNRQGKKPKPHPGVSDGTWEKNKKGSWKFDSGCGDQVLWSRQHHWWRVNLKSWSMLRLFKVIHTHKVKK